MGFPDYSRSNEYYTHPDLEVRDKHGWGRDIDLSPFNWIYWQDGLREKKLMDRRQGISAVLGILATAITICTVAYLIYLNAVAGWDAQAQAHESAAALCQYVVDSEQSDVIIDNTC